jgi:hypothetical protein
VELKGSGGTILINGHAFEVRDLSVNLTAGGTAERYGEPYSAVPANGSITCTFQLADVNVALFRVLIFRALVARHLRN